MTLDDPLILFQSHWTTNPRPIDAATLKRYPAYAFIYFYPFASDSNVTDECSMWAQDNFQEWIGHFRAHFKKPEGVAEKTIRRNLEATNADDIESFQIADDPLHWRNMQPWSCQAFEWCLNRISKLEKAEHVACILPPILQMAEDHETFARSVGARCLRRLVLVSPGLVARMGLADLIIQILKINLSFHESSELVAETTSCLEFLITVYCGEKSAPGWRYKKFSSEYFALLDEFMEVIIRDLSLCRVDSPCFPHLLASLNVLIRLQQLGSVRFLSDLLQLIAELASGIGADSKELYQLFEVIKVVCAPRIAAYKSICDHIQASLSGP